MNIKTKYPAWKASLFVIWAIAMCWIYINCVLVKNVTSSLPYKYFVVVKNSKIKRNDYVMFKSDNYHMNLIKQVKGVKGDTVQRRDSAMFINNSLIGEIKSHSKQGDKLEPMENTIIGKEQYFVASAHPDSLDSRYANIGLINEADLIGVAYPVW